MWCFRDTMSYFNCELTTTLFRYLAHFQNNPSPSNTPPSHSPTNTPTNTPVNNPPPPATSPNNPGTTPNPQPSPSDSNTGTTGQSATLVPNSPSVISISGSAITTLSGSSVLPASLTSGMQTSTLPLLSASSRPTGINGANSTLVYNNGTIATTNGTAQDSGSDSSHSDIGIAVGVSIAAAIIIALVVFFVVRKRRNASAALDDDGDFRSFDAVFDEKEASVKAREVGEIGIDKETPSIPKGKFTMTFPNVLPASRSLSTSKPRLSAIPPPPPAIAPWIETTTVPSEGLGRYPIHTDTTPPSEEISNPFVPIPPPARKRNSNHSNILNAMTRPHDSFVSEKSKKSSASQVRESMTSVLSEPVSMLSESALQGVDFPEPPASDASSVYSTSTYNQSVYQHSRHPSNADSISDNPFFDRDEQASPNAPSVAIPAVPAIPAGLVRKASRPPTADHPTIQETSESVRDSSESRRSVDPSLQLALQERQRRSEIVSAYIDDEDYQDSPVSAEFFDAPAA